MNKPGAILLALLCLAAILAAEPLFAGGATGKVVSADAEKVVVQLGKGKGTAFPTGMRDVEIKKDGATIVRGRITASGGDKITLKVLKGKSGGLSTGASVEVEQSTASEGIDGC